MWEDAEYYAERESHKGKPLQVIRDWSKRFDSSAQYHENFTRREKDYTRKIARSNKISYDEAWELYTKKAFDPYSTQHKPINLDMPGAPIFEEGVEWVTTFNQ